MRVRDLAIALLVTAVVAAPAAAAPRPGADGIGDRLFPQLGNGGYDAKHYDLSVSYASSAPEQDVAGKVTMVARATQSLSRFDLDFSGDTVGAVRVDGRSADFERAGQELVVTPAHAIKRGRTFEVVVNQPKGRVLSGAGVNGPETNRTTTSKVRPRLIA